MSGNRCTRARVHFISFAFVLAGDVCESNWRFFILIVYKTSLFLRDLIFVFSACCPLCLFFLLMLPKRIGRQKYARALTHTHELWLFCFCAHNKQMAIEENNINNKDDELWENIV